MKKSILIVLSSLFIVFTVKAQISKGSVFLGGSFLYSHTSGDSKAAVYFSPQVGTTFKENSVAGILLIYGDAGPSVGLTFNSYGGGLFLRKYKQLGKSFYLFAHGQLGYLYLKQISSSISPDIQTSKQSAYSLSIFPGISYAVSRKFHIDVTINNLLFISYNKSNTNYTSPGSSIDTKSNTFSIAMNNQTNSPFTLGFNFIL